MKKNFLWFILFVLFLVTSCDSSLKEKGEPNYINEIKEWHTKRIDNLKKENGWLNLVGLFWLKEGENKFGADKTNDIIFSEKIAEKFMGSFIKNDSVITIRVNDGIDIYSNSTKISQMELRYDLQGNPTVHKYKTLRWFAIKRGDKFGIRLRDLEADLVKNFSGIDTFPINDDWRIEAKFDEYNPTKEIEIPNILGTIEKEKSPGTIVFIKEGKEYRLDVTDAGSSYFIVFADLTSGDETYGAGRFLYVNKPDSSGKIIIDFNKAYNPPCAFTKYATCPLPPRQNYLKLEVTAGEKNFEGGAH